MIRETVEDNFWDLRNLKNGAIVYDIIKDEFRLLILRGPGGWCAYIGVPSDSPLWGKFYEDDIFSNFYCHGGLTFASAGDDINRPEGWYYFGWDYAHSGDWSPHLFSHNDGELQKKWTFGEVKEELLEELEQLKVIDSEARTRKMVRQPAKLQSVKRGSYKRLIRVEEVG